MTGPMISKVYSLMKHIPSPSKDKASAWCSEGVDFDVMLSALSVLLKGTVEEKAHIICFMATSDNEDTLKLKDLRIVRKTKYIFILNISYIVPHRIPL